MNRLGTSFEAVRTPPAGRGVLIAFLLIALALLLCGLVAMARGRIIRGAILAGVPLALAGLVALAYFLR